MPPFYTKLDFTFSGHKASMKHGLASLAFALLVFLIGAAIPLAPVRANGVGNYFCLIGTCVIDNPVYTNVYWDNVGQWDTDVVKAGRPDLLRAKIDGVIWALIRSQFFSQLAQYKVYAPAMNPSIQPNCGPAPASMTAIKSNDTVLNNFITCVTGQFPALINKNTILNVYFPPTTNPGAFGTGADHKQIRSVAITVLPTNQTGYNTDISRLLEMASHEMIEAATDPNQSNNSPTGYKNRDPGSEFGEEIADLCPNSLNFPFLGVSDGQNTGLTEYWSDNANSCVNPFKISAPTPPTIAKITPCGSGRNMSLTITGTFGPPPWDLTAGTFAGQTMYLNLTVSGPTDNWSAGNVLNGDAVTLGPITWNQVGNGYPTDTITIQGFGPAYGGGQVIRPGDVLTVSVYSMQNGEAGTAAVTAPSPAGLQFDPTSNLNVGTAELITGVAYAGSGCMVEGVNLTLSANPGTFTWTGAPGPLVTASDGSFAAKYQAPLVAGMVTVTAASAVLPAPATLKFAALPVLSALSPDLGPVAGGGKVTATGLGFDSHAGATTALVRGVVGPNGNINVSATPTVDQVAENNTSVVVTMPQSPFERQGTILNSAGGLYSGTGAGQSPAPPGSNPFPGGGEAEFTITVNGAVSNELPYTYRCPSTGNC